METNSNNNNNRKEGELETWVWFVSQRPMDAAAQHDLIESLSVLTGMSYCAAIGIPLSICTGTEEIAGWEKVTWPNEPTSPRPKVSQRHLPAFSLYSSLLCLPTQCLVGAFMFINIVLWAGVAVLAHLLAMTLRMNPSCPNPFLSFIFYFLDCVPWFQPSLITICRALSRFFYKRSGFSADNLPRHTGKGLLFADLARNSIPVVSSPTVPHYGIYRHY